MMKMITILILATLCASVRAEAPWGSRIVTTKAGPVDVVFNMEKAWGDQFGGTGTFDVFGKTGTKVVVSVTTAATVVKCVEGKGTDEKANKYIEKCTFAAGTNDKDAILTVKVKDVTALKQINVAYTEKQIMTVFFAPECKILAPSNGEVVVAQSTPLSRFVKGSATADLPLNFAIMGVGEKSEVSLSTNGVMTCKWMGLKLTSTNVDACITGVGTGEKKTDLTQSKDNTMRTAALTVKVADKAKDFYQWGTTDNFLSITVDGAKEGKSTEMGTCTELAPYTTSAGSVVSYLIALNMGLLGTLLYLRK